MSCIARMCGSGISMSRGAASCRSSQLCEGFHAKICLNSLWKYCWPPAHMGTWSWGSNLNHGVNLADFFLTLGCQWRRRFLNYPPLRVGSPTLRVPNCWLNGRRSVGWPKGTCHFRHFSNWIAVLQSKKCTLPGCIVGEAEPEVVDLWSMRPFSWIRFWLFKKSYTIWYNRIWHHVNTIV